MVGFIRRAVDLVAHPSHSRTVGVLVVFLMVAAVSLTVYVAQQQQQIRQHAAETSCRLIIDLSQYSIISPNIKENVTLEFTSSAVPSEISAQLPKNTISTNTSIIIEYTNPNQLLGSGSTYQVKLTITSGNIKGASQLKTFKEECQSSIPTPTISTINISDPSTQKNAALKVEFNTKDNRGFLPGGTKITIYGANGAKIVDKESLESDDFIKSLPTDVTYTVVVDAQEPNVWIPIPRAQNVTLDKDTTVNVEFTEKPVPTAPNPATPIPTPIPTLPARETLQKGAKCNQTPECAQGLVCLVFCVIPTPTLTLIPIPTVTSTPTPPTATPTVPPAPTAVPPSPIAVANCPADSSKIMAYKTQGDANCDGKVNRADFNIWSSESSGTLNTKLSDFNGDGAISRADFNIWSTYAGDTNVPH